MKETTMSDMKCPFCNRNLHKGEDGIYSHLDYMTECKGRLFDGSKELWQELIRTCKALDVAVKRLGYIKNNYKSWTPDRDEQMIAQAANGLDEIKTTLEQKDVK